MSAAKLDLVVEQGATFRRVITVKDADKNPIDITGWVFAGQIREKYSSPTVAAEFDFEILDQTEAKGKVKVSLSADDTSALVVAAQGEGDCKKLSTYLYDIEATKEGVGTDRILEGKVFVSPEVTREAP